MGQDKALMPFLGKPLIQRIVAQLSPLADEVLVTTNQSAAYRFLGLPLHPDIFTTNNALGGLYTALTVARHPEVAVVACDMPFASSSLLQFQVQILAEGWDLVIPQSAKGLEPLHAVYRRETCLPLIRNALENQRWKLTGWLAEANTRVLSPAEIAPFDPSGLAFWNVNTPEAFAEAEKAANHPAPPGG